MNSKDNSIENKNNELDLSIEKEFELREKRIKLVYKILYAIVAFWGITFWSLISSDTSKTLVPIYSFILSVATLYIVSIIKYSLNELSCMRVHDKASEYEKSTTELSFVNIWQNATLPLIIGAITMFFNVAYIDCYGQNYFMWLFLIFGILSVLSNITKLICSIKEKKHIVKIISWVDPIFSEVMTYSIFAICCLAVAK